MFVVEIVFSGQGGLEQLMDQTASALEASFERHGLAWNPKYPVTLRESLGLGLQQQIIGGSLCQNPGTPAPESKAYRVWLALPDGGLRGWTNLLVQRILAGCGEEGIPQGGRTRKELQRILVAQLGPYMERSEVPSLLSGAL